MPKAIIHVNKHVIGANLKHNRRDPPITVKTKGRNVKGSLVQLLLDGIVVAEILYRPDKPLACGARVWTETHLEVRVDGRAVRKRAKTKQ